MERLASSRLARHARLRHDGRNPSSCQCHAAPKKRTAERPGQQPQSLIAIDPLVGPGNPPHRHPPCPKTDQSRQHHAMVSLATCASSRRSESAHQTKYATVMLMHAYAWYVWRKEPRHGPSLKVRVGRREAIAIVDEPKHGGGRNAPPTFLG